VALNASPKWMQCAELAATGLGPKEIAFRLKLSDKTVEGHLKNAKRHMGLNGWGQAPFILNRASVADRIHLHKIDRRLTQIEEHLKLALDILLEMRGH
jgi:DNA-binding NarL/FixJ family response regulator